MWRNIETDPPPYDKEPVRVWNGKNEHVAVWDKIECSWVSTIKTVSRRVAIPGRVTHWTCTTTPTLPDAEGWYTHDGESFPSGVHPKDLVEQITDGMYHRDCANHIAWAKPSRYRIASAEKGKLSDGHC